MDVSFCFARTDDLILVPERAPNLIYNTSKILYYYFLNILDTKKNANKSKGYPLPVTSVHFQLTTPPRFRLPIPARMNLPLCRG